MILLMRATGSVFNRRASVISASEVREHVAAAAYLSSSIEPVVDLIQIGRVLASVILSLAVSRSGNKGKVYGASQRKQGSQQEEKFECMSKYGYTQDCHEA